VARRKRDGRPGHQYGDQCGQTEILLRSVQRRAHLRPAVFHTLYLFTGQRARFEPLTVCIDRRRRTGQEGVVRDPAVGGDQTGGGEVSKIDHQPRGQLKPLTAAIGLEVNNPRELKATPAECNAYARA
jgi:hypothetical protein